MSAFAAEWVDAIVELAERAGAAIEDVRRCGFAVQHKADHSPLTEADLAAQAILGPGLKALAPQFPVISEEAVPASFLEAVAAPGYFVVDPLDGTKEFIACTGEYSVNIALIQHGRPVLGVICQPTTGKTWIGQPGSRCERREADGSRHLVRVKPAKRPLRVALSRFHPSEALNAALEALGDYEAVTIGASLKFIGLVEDRLDLYPRLKSGMSQWDIAAGHAILEAAGGFMTRLDGAPLHYHAEQLLAPGFIAYADASIDWVRLLRGQGGI